MSETNPVNPLVGVPISERISLAVAHPLQWRIPGTLLDGGVHLLHGREECFKTTLTLQMLETLSLGGKFLGYELTAGLRVGLAELEMSEKIFNAKLAAFSGARKDGQIAEILTLNETVRLEILRAKTAQQRIEPLAKFSKLNRLDVLAIDSAAKLFPPTSDSSSQTAASDVFNHLQSAGAAVWLIAHDRKSIAGLEKSRGNQEIAGSGRFAQDPDLVLECVRPDQRSPEAFFSWGKVRIGFKQDDIAIYFDAVEQRLFPFHPFLHLLPATREELIHEAANRFQWKRSSTDGWIKLMEPMVIRTTRGHEAHFDLDPTKDPKELLETSNKYQGPWERLNSEEE
jgi:hypothetical protein